MKHLLIANSLKSSFSMHESAKSVQVVQSVTQIQSITEQPNGQFLMVTDNFGLEISDSQLIFNMIEALRTVP